MAAIVDRYPIAQALVRGDPVAIPVTIGVEDDIDDWTWRAQVRSVPDGELVAVFDVALDDHTLTLSLEPEVSALLVDGMGFDVEQLTPTERTWCIVRSLWVEKDFSRDIPEDD